jgi:transposase InsO family protein
MPHSLNDNGWTRTAVAKQLSNLYYSAGDPGSYGGVNRLYKRAKEVGIPVTQKDVSAYLSKQLPYAIHKPVRHTFQRNHTYAGHIDQQWQADLADMQTLAGENGGYRYILTCIDILSRFGWAVPVRSKSAKDMLIAFNKLFRATRPRMPQRLQTDKGKEFFNREVSALLRSKNIRHFA